MLTCRSCHDRFDTPDQAECVNGVSNLEHCPECWDELALGILHPPAPTTPRGKGDPTTAGEIEYQGGRFHAGEW